MPSLRDFSTYLNEKICASKDPRCLQRAEAVASADYLDIDYDSISQSLVLKSYRHRSFQAEGQWHGEIKAIGDAKLEIGVLAPEVATEQEQLKLGGFLAVVGEDDKLSKLAEGQKRTISNSSLEPTLFAFASRHHPLPQDYSVSSSLPSTYTVSFLEPTGLHPQLRLSISSTVPADTTYPESCSLHTYITLPSTLFPDKYQLANPLLLNSLNIRKIRSISGYTDLEAPDYAVKPWGSSILIELQPPLVRSGRASEISEQQWNATIPLHLRYLGPINGTNGIAETTMPWPVVFWACAAEEGSKMTNNPFDRVSLGYDGLFGTNSMFYHLKPKPNVFDGKDFKLVEALQVPVLDAAWVSMRNGWVEGGTGVVVVLGWLWVVWKLWLVFLGDLKETRPEKEKKKQ